MNAVAPKYKPYPAYKASGVEWLGDVPEHWPSMRLKNTVLDCLNGAWGAEADGGADDTACVRVADFDRQKRRVVLDEPTLRAVSRDQRRELTTGDLLLEKSGGGDKQPVGTVVLYDLDAPAICSNFVARMRIKGGHSAPFLCYLHEALYSAQVNTRSIKQNTGIQNLDSEGRVRHDYLPSLLRELLALPGETEWAEFKCNNDNPQQIGEYISALANSAALRGKPFGYVVWGVDDGTHQVVGTTFRPSKARKGDQELENWLVTQLQPRLEFRFHEFEYQGANVAIIEIPKAERCPVQFRGEEFIRVGTYKKKLKEFPEKERELWRGFDTTPFEAQIAAEGVAAGDVLKLLDYPSYFRLLDLPLPENRTGILDRLAADRMVRRRESASYDITNLGAILFATDLQNFDRLQRKAIRVIEYRGANRVETRREQPGRRGYAVGFEGLIEYINQVLPENEVIERALRGTVTMYPELAIRELVANAIIHQDFSICGTGPMVEIFEHRMEITNPGLPLVDTLRFLDDPPISRNEGLAAFMRRINVCEERGSGIDKVVFETELYQLPAPKFEVTAQHTRASLFAHRDFAAMQAEDRIRACYLHACLRYVSSDLMTNASLRERFRVDQRNYSMISRLIKDTIEAGLVKPHDPSSRSRKHAKYLPFWA